MKVFSAWFSDGSTPLRLVEHWGVSLDRFDVRHFLSSPPVLDEHVSRLEKALDKDRYRDLFEARQKNKRRKMEPKAEKREKGKAVIPQLAYDPTLGFECPFEGLLFCLSVHSHAKKVPQSTCIPETEKQHGVIMQTIAFVVQHGPNTGVEIRRRQCDNPLFAFLDETDLLHPCNVVLFLLFCFSNVV
jgi:hypothetical protein